MNAPLRNSGAARQQDVDTLNEWVEKTGGYASAHYSAGRRGKRYQVELNGGEYYGVGDDWEEAYRLAAEAVTLSPTLDPAVLPGWDEE